MECFKSWEKQPGACLRWKKRSKVWIIKSEMNPADWPIFIFFPSSFLISSKCEITRTFESTLLFPMSWGARWWVTSADKRNRSAPSWHKRKPQECWPRRRRRRRSRLLRDSMKTNKRDRREARPGRLLRHICDTTADRVHEQNGNELPKNEHNSLGSTTAECRFTMFAWNSGLH